MSCAHREWQVSRPRRGCFNTVPAMADRQDRPITHTRTGLRRWRKSQGELSASHAPDGKEVTGLTDLQKGKEWTEPWQVFNPKPC